MWRVGDLSEGEGLSMEKVRFLGVELAFFFTQTTKRVKKTAGTNTKTVRKRVVISVHSFNILSNGHCYGKWALASPPKHAHTLGSGLRCHGFQYDGRLLDCGRLLT